MAQHTCTRTQRPNRCELTCARVARGPNATTFIIPSETFPAKYRSTGHGISAAMGKAGAIIGTFAFKSMAE
jgi:hypothetical protein